MEKKNDKNKHEVIVKFDGETWKKALEESYKKNNKNAKIDGFRPGKAPYDIFVRHYGVESLFMDAADGLLQEAYMKALESSKLIPVVKPSFDIKEVNEEAIEFVFTITTKPELKIKKYKDLKIKKDELVVTDEEIDHEVGHLLEHYAELVVKEGKVENGDIVIIDYEGSVDGVPFEGGKAENADLEIGSGTFIPGFEEQLIGMEKESEKDITVTFPEDYHAENLKGKEAVFKIKLHEIKTKQNRELDEEFFEDLGMEGVNSLETLKESIKEHIESHKKVDIENKFIDELMDSIAKKTEVDIPEEMVEEEIDHLMERAEENLKHQGVNLEFYYAMTKTTEKDLRDQFEKEAFRNVLYRLILEEIMSLEEIKVEDKDIDEYIEETATKYNATKEEITNEFGGREFVGYDLSVRRTFEKLTEYNEVK